MITNTNYILSVLKGKIKVAGGSVAHIGFGLMLVGIILSMSKQEVISLNHDGTGPLTINLDDYESGVYTVKLLYKDKILTKSIVLE